MIEKKVIIHSSIISEELAESLKQVKFLHWDDSGHTRTRPAEYGFTIMPTPIKDGPEPENIDSEDNRPIIAWWFICIVPDDFLPPEGVTVENA